MTQTETTRVWMTTAQAAEYVAVDPVTLWRARRRGLLKVGSAGRTVRYHREELDRWLRSSGEGQK